MEPIQQPLPDLKLLKWTGNKIPQQTNQISIDPTKFKQLLGLVYGDTTIALRLLNQQQKLHPGKTSSWYLEKTIQDVKRDRNS
ncbi:hypothetical protein NIES4075_25640 [Tolypothrix sp. NIES-4075]|uniref:hypothetical protein n=1 Tax=Tolypothrix sp. NIES-4075 TaxID=2005459 RepID=UPI000B5C55A5|nr:hypothetical protein [Tolypothrix sp. NIES-4075]GAX41568.1 hypothetical protein NIES4075_25640 [Tolypothrix sp. NIES-4075]